MNVLVRCMLIGCGLWTLACAPACSPSRPQPIEREPMDSGATTSAATPGDSASALPSPADAGRAEPPGPMVLIRGGTFRMGSDSMEGPYNSSPAHTVKVASFRIDVTEVTVAAYRACVRAGACTEPLPRSQWLACTWDVPGLDAHPVNCVTWAQVDAYCKWAGKELPSEEQWEAAARGRSGRDFPWGMGIAGRDWGMPEDEAPYLRGCQPWPNRTCPVGSAPKGDTPEGVHDLAGNVAEWTASTFCSYDQPSCVSSKRVIRGGALSDGGRERHAANRVGIEPTRAEDRFGFRCAQRVEEGKAP